MSLFDSRKAAMVGATRTRLCGFWGSKACAVGSRIEESGAGKKDTVLLRIHSDDLGHDGDRLVGLAADERLGVEPGAYHGHQVLSFVLDGAGVGHQQIGDEARHLRGGKQRPPRAALLIWLIQGFHTTAASTRPLMKAAAASPADRLTMSTSRGNEPVALQGGIEHEVRDAVLLERDFPAAQVGECLDFGRYHQRIVAGRVVVDENRLQRHALGERAECVRPGLTVGVELAGGERGDGIRVVGEPDQLTLAPYLRK